MSMNSLTEMLYNPELGKYIASDQKASQELAQSISLLGKGTHDLDLASITAGRKQLDGILNQYKDTSVVGEIRGYLEDIADRAYNFGQILAYLLSEKAKAAYETLKLELGNAKKGMDETLNIARKDYDLAV